MQIFIEGIRSDNGLKFRSIAIDDVSFTPECRIKGFEARRPPTTLPTTSTKPVSTTTAITTSTAAICPENYCLNGGTCTVKSNTNSYVCTCGPKYTGKKCEYNLIVFPERMTRKSCFV